MALTKPNVDIAAYSMRNNFIKKIFSKIFLTKNRIM